MYDSKYHPKVKKDLKNIDPHIRSNIKNKHIPIILESPEIGEELVGDLLGTRSYHLKIAKQHFRIAYIIDEASRTIIVQKIGKRGDFYTLLKKRVQ